MSDKFRIALNNSRSGSAKHNDRQFDIGRAEHIDPERMAENRYWHCYQRTDPELTFDEAEAKFYNDHFRAVLDDQNQRAIDAGHPERVRDMDAYRRAKKTCPEESLTYIGHAGQTVDANTLRAIVAEQAMWERKTYPNFRLLNIALHTDEAGAPHIHRRGVWIAHDTEGREIIGQNRALAEMGVQRPDPTKPEGRRNNAKMTYTARCREHLQMICKQRGIDIETRPRERSKSGLSLTEYQTRQAEERLQQAEAQIADLRAENDALREQLGRAEKSLEQAKNDLRETLTENRVALEGLRDVLTEKAKAAEIKKPLFSRQNDIQTYHKNMIESTRAIGENAYRYLQQAQEIQQDIARRESALQQAEARASKTIQQADIIEKHIQQQAHEMRNNAEQYIREQAEQRFQRFKEQVFDQYQDDRSERLEAFCKSYKVRGRSLYEMFEKRERELENRINHDWYDRDR